MGQGVKKTIADPAEIFRVDFPAPVRDQILAEARKHMAMLAPALAEMAFSQLPPEIKTPENRKAMEQGARATVALETSPVPALAGTIRILRAWITKLEIDDGPIPGTTKILIAYRKM